MALNTKITPGLPPLIWSSINDAFSQVNLNFQEIAASIGSESLVNFTALQSSISPATTNTFTLGTSVDSWKRLHVSEYANIAGSEQNGLWAGTAQIKGINGTIDLPTNSTVNGNLIIDPFKTTFKTINVQGVEEIVAGSFTDTLNLIPGDGITLGVSSETNSITVVNNGVVELLGSTYLTVDQLTPGRFTLTNSGVTNFSNTTVLPSSRPTGAGIHVDNATGTVRITNTGVISVVSTTSALTITTETETGVVSITNNAPDRDAFGFIQVSDQPTIAAGGVLSTLTVAEGYGIVVTTDALLQTLTVSLDQSAGAIDLRASIFADDSTLLVNAVDGNIPAENLIGIFTGTVIGNVTGNLTGNVIGNTIGTHDGDVTGSIFADDSTMLVDGVSGKIVGDIETARLRTSETSIALGQNAGLLSQSGSAVAIGSVAGLTNQGASAIGIGFGAGGNNQGISAVAIGAYAGSINQGAYSIAIGDNAGLSNQPANSIVINGSGSPVSNAAAGLYVRPIREVTGPQTVYYNPVTYEVTWGPVPSGGTGGSTSDYTFSVAGDDSTQRVISNGETLQFVGASGITTTTDGEGKVTITAPTLATVATSGSYTDLINQPVIPSIYEFKVAGDDSTQRVISSGETLKFVGVSGITTTSDAEGQITISAAGVSGLSSRSTTAGSTGSIADAATANVTVVGFKGYILYKIQTSAAAWVRLYTSVAARTADSARLENEDPLPGAGVIAEVISTGAETILITPGTIGFNDESSPTTDIAMVVTNKSGGAADITVTLTIVKVEE